MSNATHSIEVNVPLERAYGVWRDFENWPKFIPLLKEVQGTGDRTAITRMATPVGKVECHVEVTNEHPGESFQWHTKTGDVEQVPCEALITLLGFHSHLGAIADWGLELHGKRQLLIDPMTCETTIPGVYAAGDVAGYEGKITLITIGMGEAAIAANNAVARIRGEKVQPKYSTD